MPEREKLPKVITEAFEDLPEDQLDPGRELSLDPEKTQAFFHLLYDIHSLAITKIQSRKLSQRGLERAYELSGSRTVEPYQLNNAASMVVRKLWHSNLIERDRRESRRLQHPLGRGAKFRFREGNLFLARAYEILADFGELGGIEPSVVLAHRDAARFRREKNLHRDHRF